MIVCQHCGTDNKDHWKFCLGCGQELCGAPQPTTGSRPEMVARTYRGKWCVRVRRTGPGMADVLILEQVGKLGPSASTMPLPLPEERHHASPRAPVPSASARQAAAPAHTRPVPRLPKIWMPLPEGLPPGSKGRSVPPATEEMRFGFWRVRRLFANAGMVDLYEAEHAVTGWTGWVKALRTTAPDSADACERFWREVDIIARLPRKYVGGLLDAGRTPEGRPFVVIQPLDGETLESRLRRCGALDVGEASAIAVGAAEALDAIHAEGIVHRDVKPANLFLAKDPPLVRLLDFGIARPIRTDRDLTPEGSIVGTPAYMSPEALRGLPVDNRADIYGLGCVLYEMLSGASPFAEAKTLNELMAKVRLDPSPPLHGLRAPVPLALSGLVTRMLAKDPDRRPDSCRPVIELLDRIVRMGAH